MRTDTPREMLRRTIRLTALADALGADPEDLEAIAEEMEAVGMTVRHQPAGSLH